MPALNVNRSVASQFLGSFDGLCLGLKDPAGALGIWFAHCPPFIVNFYKYLIVTMATHTQLLSRLRFDFALRLNSIGAINPKIRPQARLVNMPVFCNLFLYKSWPPNEDIDGGATLSYKGTWQCLKDRSIALLANGCAARAGRQSSAREDSQTVSGYHGRPLRISKRDASQFTFTLWFGSPGNLRRPCQN
jgi:hypothetical protein